MRNGLSNLRGNRDSHTNQRSHREPNNHEPENMISSVVLAAGRADRASEQKLLMPLRDKPVLQWVLEGALASDLHEIVCVVHNLEAVRRKISLVHERLYWLTNHAADQGQSTSVIAGLWAIDPKSVGALFLVGNEPMVQHELIDSLVERFKTTNALIVAPSFRGQTRDPVLFRRDLFPELLQLTGDRAGRGLIEKYPKKTALVEWNDEVSFKDMDVCEGYEKMKGS
jgi:molybdenum cofactor cytidylyltransferase